MNWNPAVKNVLVQATYMSGDRNGIASALRLDKTLGVVILTEPGALQSGDVLKNFYASVAGPDRVTSVAVPSVPGKDARGSLTEAYKAATGSPAWLKKEIGSRKVKVQSATFGTKVIANAFGEMGPGRVVVPNSANAIAARGQLQTLWRLGSTSAELEEKVGTWLEKKKRFNPNNRYVFLFAKQGDRSAEKAHHFTSILTWNLLKDRLDQHYQDKSNNYRIIPVAAGDRIGLRTDPDLAEFWNDPEWKEILKGTAIDARSAQLGLWCYFAMLYPNVSIIGMRSGMIEVPALVGIRTLFLEEAFNAQAARMEKWLGGVVPGFDRSVVDVPPGIAQGLYWKENSAAQPKGQPPQIRRQEVRTALNGLQTGWTPSPGSSNSQSKNWPTVQPESSALSPENASAANPGVRSAMAPVLNQIPGKGIDNFMLQKEALDAIMEWIGDGTGSV
ncbi:hypothetical protein [Granulicella mallensis]|uniref:Uncharacterized protein n=1 Tax=Granulicella mallensis TaxID=940614 RepID=A0A7W7ZQ15_9BACT|nr:hypothetical protein [Granulicella mallensis]MBB5064020.1 hypothetical protein [Granulicella mallensis]